MTSTPTLSWYILRFEEGTGDKKQTRDILFMSDPQQTLTEAARALDSTLFERFDRLGDFENGDAFHLKRLCAIDTFGSEIEITLQQLVTYLRDLPQQPTAKTPDLFGFGTNRIRVEFGYVEVTM